MATDQELLATTQRASAHPYKLAVDVIAITVAMVPLWSRHWLIAAAVAIVPGLIATLVVAWLDPDRVVRPLATWVQLVRLAAVVGAGWAAWTHQLAVLIIALAIGAIVVLPWPGSRQRDL